MQTFTVTSYSSYGGFIGSWVLSFPLAFHKQEYNLLLFLQAVSVCLSVHYGFYKEFVTPKIVPKTWRIRVFREGGIEGGEEGGIITHLRTVMESNFMNISLGVQSISGYSY